MSSTDYELRIGALSAHESCSGFRGWMQDLGSALTTPPGTLGLAALTFAAGLMVAGSYALPGTRAAHLEEQLQATTAELQQAQGHLAVHEIQSQRLGHVQEFSSQHDIPADLASSIYDISLAEGLRPELAFRLVETESTFRQRAVSQMGAVGYTQIKPSTAMWMDPSLTYEDLFETETNLRLGFRYFSLLLERYEQDERLALLAYNRGPTRVGTMLAMGHDPANGYAQKILTGAK